MTDTPSIKLNLKALGREEDKQEDLKNEAIAKETLKKPTISLNLKEDTKKEDTTVVPWNTTEQAQKVESKVESTKEDTPQKGYIHLDSINKYVADKKEDRAAEKAQEKQENINAAKKEEKKEEDSKSDIHFDNYTSHFEKQSKNVFKRIRNFRYTPKTRTGLILSLIVFTCMIVGGLMVLFPQNHSISVYKTSILEIYDQSTYTKWRWNTNQTPDNLETWWDTNDTDVPNTPPPWEEPQIEEEQEIEEVKTEIEIEEIKKKKVKDHLLNKYSF